jgi:hypothetical protein
MSTSPIHTAPSPVFSAMASPYLVSLKPANRMTTRQKINASQTKGDASWNQNNFKDYYTVMKL